MVAFSNDLDACRLGDKQPVFYPIRHATDTRSVALIGTRMTGMRPVDKDEQLAVLRFLPTAVTCLRNALWWPRSLEGTDRASVRRGIADPEVARGRVGARFVEVLLGCGALLGREA